MDLAIRLDGLSTNPDEPVEVSFEPVDRITTAEKYQAALAAHNAGESWKSIQRNILGYSPDQIAQDEIDRAEEALMVATMMPQLALPPGGQQPQPNTLSASGERMPTSFGGAQPGGR